MIKIINNNIYNGFSLTYRKHIHIKKLNKKVFVLKFLMVLCDRNFKIERKKINFLLKICFSIYFYNCITLIDIV